MSNLNELIIRVREILNDPSALRFSETVLEEGVRQAMQRINDRLPQVLETEVPVVESGRNQPLTGLSDPIYLISIAYPVSASETCELEPEVQFSYRMQAGQPIVHFLGSLVPQAGEKLSVSYAARHTLSGLEGALSTTLPDGVLTGLVNGAAGHACLLRAHALTEASGVKSSEVAQLLQIAQLRLDLFEKNLADLKVFQEFGFPPGFSLDQWDARHEVF